MFKALKYAALAFAPVITLAIIASEVCEAASKKSTRLTFMGGGKKSRR